MAGYHAPYYHVQFLGRVIVEIRIPDARFIIGCIDQNPRLVLIAYLVIVKKISDSPFSFRFEMYLLRGQYPFESLLEIFHGVAMDELDI